VLVAAASSLSAGAAAAQLVCKLQARPVGARSGAVLMSSAGCFAWAGGDRTTLGGPTANECCAMPSRRLVLWVYHAGRLTAGEAMMICKFSVWPLLTLSAITVIDALGLLVMHAVPCHRVRQAEPTCSI